MNYFPITAASKQSDRQRHCLFTFVLLFGCSVDAMAQEQIDSTIRPATSATVIVVRSQEATLADAVEARDTKSIDHWLQCAVDVNQPQADGMTALHWAVFYDDGALAQRLLQAGADANGANRYGMAPLSTACIHGCEATAFALLSAGATVDAPLRGGETALMLAARSGAASIVSRLIERGANVNVHDRRGQTGLMWAAAEGHVDVVRILLRGGANVRQPLPSGFTPLFFAVREGRLEVVRLLIDAGAEIQTTMRPERSFARAPRPGTSPLLMAVENAHFEVAIALLDAGADPNDQQTGVAPLHLLSWVRKPNRGDDEDGDPAPNGSGSVTSLQFVKSLVDHGADVNLRLERATPGKGKLNLAGCTPLLMACRTDDVALMQCLLALGADPTIANVDGCTPLMAAAGVGTLAPGEEAGTEEEAVAAISVLLALGAEVNGVDANGETAMHGAAYKSVPRVAQLLAQHGAKPEVWNRPNRYGWTPLKIAQGERPGNFKPAPEMAAAIEALLH